MSHSTLTTPLAGLATLLGLTAAVVLLAVLLINPPNGDLASLALFLLASGGLSLCVVIAVVQMRSRRLLPNLQQKLLFALALMAALFAVNVGFTAYLMFLSSHDLEILTLVLLFSLGMSAFFAIAISRSFHAGLLDLLEAVRSMGGGNLRARANPGSNDELEELADAFNIMAARLEASFARQQDLEGARRGLVAAVSHDLRTPLATMRAMVESINDGVVSDSVTIRRYLQTIQVEIEYLARLIDDLFELSQIDSGLLDLRPEQTNMRDLISDTLEAVSAQAQQRGLVLRGEVDEALPTVVADPQRVQRVLYNLVQNSVRHTPADGAIVIRAIDAGLEVQVSVADTGAGIAPEELPSIFERFDRGSNRARVRSGGSGLGLSIAHGIVELHGGRIWAESTLGQGTTFTFALPKADSAIPSRVSFA